MQLEEEIELKLQVADASAWEALAAYVSARGEAARPLEMEAVYFDTLEEDLRRARLAYRVRREGAHWIATLKGGGSSGGGLHRRSEWNRPVIGPQPDLTLFADVLGERTFLAGKALQPVVRTAFVRQAVLLEWEGSVLEAALDRGVIEAGGQTAPILEVELELKRGCVTAALACGAQLAQRFPLVLEARSKYLRGLLLAGLAQDTRARPAPPVSAQDAVLSLAAHLRDAWAEGMRADAQFCLPRVEYLEQFPWKTAEVRAELALWRAHFAEETDENWKFLSILLRIWKEISADAKGCT